MTPTPALVMLIITALIVLTVSTGLFALLYLRLLYWAVVMRRRAGCWNLDLWLPFAGLAGIAGFAGWMAWQFATAGRG